MIMFLVIFTSILTSVYMGLICAVTAMIHWKLDPKETPARQTILAIFTYGRPVFPLLAVATVTLSILAQPETWYWSMIMVAPYLAAMWLAFTIKVTKVQVEQ